MKYLLFIFFLSCTNEQLPDNHKPIEIVFVSKDLEAFDAVNDLRLRRNIAPLKGEKLLTDGCKQHSIYMFSSETISHDYFWSRYIASKSKGFAEVLCYGYNTTASQISAYESSPEHYNVLMNPKYTHIGISNIGLYQTIDLAFYK